MLIYTNLFYTLVFLLIFGLWSGSEFLGPVRWGHKRLRGKKNASQRDRGSLAISLITGITGTLLSLVLPIFVPIPSWPPVFFFAGIAVIGLGIILRWYAIRTLGQYFTATVIIEPEQSIVTSGPYRLIRHPSYAGVLLVIIGLGMMLGNWLSILFITGGLIAGILYRIPIEERELSLHTKQYGEYMRCTKRLIPFLF